MTNKLTNKSKKKSKEFDQSQPTRVFNGEAAKSTIVHYGDENDQSWLPAAKK